eukprot:8577491-Ditylum_brightwellii.AAC.1
MGKYDVGQKDLKYLVYWMTREGIMPLPNKVTAIHEIELPKSKKQLRTIIGVVSFYICVWKGRA